MMTQRARGARAFGLVDRPEPLAGCSESPEERRYETFATGRDAIEVAEESRDDVAIAAVLQAASQFDA